MASVDNSMALNNGFNLGKRLIRKALGQSLYLIAEAYLRDMAQKKGYVGFTGNTQTSYVCGIYVDGRLDAVVYQSTWTAPPVRLKVPKGKTVHLDNPYEGLSRSVKGMVSVNNRFGRDSAVQFLQGYKGVPKKGFGLVAATGTEYSEYLESKRHLNVMSGTWNVAGTIAEGEFNKIRI